ncbi:BgtA-20949 [Blumeria graminis f. sp. tritici]|uniref:BgtA-20949 n=2 Tax=Blumeria graminis f. sp. tritici TaxID=62690 RepID=A0A9X9QBX5_BLUGR|nr:hypothetical protein BGT96224_A20949 [Blumeria graminis f. sp. tritici 96224]VDB83921.1 BgtA-20949 [Blumeria graminis f. sp. tritici]
MPPEPHDCYLWALATPFISLCDEQYPTCGPCAKRQLTCDFRSTRSQSSLSDYLGTSPRHSISPRLGTNSPISASNEISQIDSDTTTRLVELKLFHHFSTQTYRTIAFKAADHVILQKYVPEIALSHPFLMNVIFAMAALHLEWLDPNRSKSWLRIGLNYQNRTLVKFTGVLQEINKQNCEAVAICSMFISVTSLAVPAVTSDETSVDPFSEISSRRSLSEGINNILRAYESDLTTGPLKDWFESVIEWGRCKPERTEVTNTGDNPLTTEQVETY